MDKIYPVQALAELALALDGVGVAWVLGGSTALSMRGAPIGRAPRDIDIYADEDAVERIHARLARMAEDSPTPSVTDRYRSILSHYRIGDTVVELVGDFQVEAFGSRYRTEVVRLLNPAGDTYRVQGCAVKLVPLGHDAIFNVLRGRSDRCELLDYLIRQEPPRHMPTLRSLLDANALTAETRERILGYVAGIQ